MNTQAILEFMVALERRMAGVGDRGQVANYIPELARVDPDQFAMSVFLASGEQLDVGLAQEPFSIQSISKVFTLALALRKQGDKLWQRVGKEPSNYAFDSAVELERGHGKPRNPFVNAGALVTVDSLLGQEGSAAFLEELLEFIRMEADDERIFINERVAQSEFESASRNAALTYFLQSFGNLHNVCDRVLRTYVWHCAIEMNCHQLARAGRFLAELDDHEGAITQHQVRRINALMLLAGHYNGSGEFAYSVGFPGKSGVGGGILAIVPNCASIAVWSPGLNEFGNSLLGMRALEELSRFTGWSIF